MTTDADRDRSLRTQSPPRDVTIPTTDGLTLRGWHWTRSSPRGVVVVTHGFGEHGACYRHIPEVIGPALDLDFVAPDLRGHGRSPGRRGVVRAYQELVDDLRATLDWTARERPGLPRFVLGHSNGGQVALREVIRASEPPAGLILSNPSLKLTARVPPFKLAIGHILLRLAPGVTLTGKIGADQMTHDPAMQREHDTDPLRHSRICAPFYFGMVEGGALILDHPEDVQVPLLMLLGEADPLVSAGASRQFFERIPLSDKTLRVYPGMLHEPFNELGREQVFVDVENWLRPRVAG
jgi:alpha-beta hydrolase superfamily lysophospholipase